LVVKVGVEMFSRAEEELVAAWRLGFEYQLTRSTAQTTTQTTTTTTLAARRRAKDNNNLSIPNLGKSDRRCATAKKGPTT